MEKVGRQPGDKSKKHYIGNKEKKRRTNLITARQKTSEDKQETTGHKWEASGKSEKNQTTCERQVQVRDKQKQMTKIWTTRGRELGGHKYDTSGFPFHHSHLIFSSE